MPTEFQDDFIDDDGPSIHEDNEDLEVFRPIVPPEKVEEITLEEGIRIMLLSKDGELII